MPNAADILVADLQRQGFHLVTADLLRYRPRSTVTPNLTKRLRTHKAELLAILGPTVRPEAANLAVGPGDCVQWEESIDPPEGCPSCGGLVFWWNVPGDRLCMACNPPTTAIRLLERAERIRRRHGVASPTGAVEMLAKLKWIAGT